MKSDSYTLLIKDTGKEIELSGDEVALVFATAIATIETRMTAREILATPDLLAIYHRYRKAIKP